MAHARDPNLTADIPSMVDSLDAGLAAAFGPASTGAWTRPPLLRDADPADSAYVVRPITDAMPKPAEVSDRYHLAGEIARGGMGAVLRGRDNVLGRDLAVKVLLEKYAKRPEIAQRFIEEAQIGGQLQHPGIVPVYDIGRFGERPYFTMKLVKGRTLAAILSERTDAGDDRARLLSVLLQVCQTLAYAHAKGVIHRDLKPANVMVGAFGEVQVMDWGLAKVLPEGGIADEERASRGVHPRGPIDEPTIIRTSRSGSAGSFGSETEAGSLLGTPAYMPPEQANGDIAHLDRRADVFGLGAILCEILTGKPPYVGRSSEEVRRKAANGDLAEARSRLDSCGADADLIALTVACLAAEAIDRPKDAQAVADAVTDHLHGVDERLRQAELAHAAEVARTEEAQSTAVQERKARCAAQAQATTERRAQRLTVGLAASVLLTAALAGGGWTWITNQQAARDRQLFAQRSQTARDVGAALDQAMSYREQARAAAEGDLSKWAEARAMAKRAEALLERGQAEPDLAERVQSLLAELAEEENDRRIVARLDEIRLMAAETNVEEGRLAEADLLPEYAVVFAEYGLMAGQTSPAEAGARIRQRPEPIRDRLVAALDVWASYAQTAKARELDWVRQVVSQADPDEWRGRLRTARAAKDRAGLEALARELDVARQPPAMSSRLGSVLGDVGAHDAAIRVLRQAQLRYPGDIWIYTWLARELRATGENTEAVRFSTAAIALRPASPGIYRGLPWALSALGKHEEAIAVHRRVIALQPRNASSYDNFGSTLFNQGKFDEAIAAHRQAIALKADSAISYFHLAQALNKRKDRDGAAAANRKAIELRPDFAEAHGNLGILLRQQGDLDGAIVELRKAIDLAPESPSIAAAYSALGQALGSRNDMVGAISAHRQAITLRPNNAITHYNLGRALAKHGDMDGAIASYRRSIELDPDYAEPHCNLGHVLQRQGQYAEALTLLRRGHELGSELPNWRYPSAEWVRQAERLIAMEIKLPAFRAGEFQPKDNEERLGLLRLCQYRELYRAAAGLSADAFAADPMLAEDLQKFYRYDAACHAALAAAGKGADAAGLDDSQRARLRKLALDWLRADLALRAKQLDSGKAADLTDVRDHLRHWQRDADLAGIRDADALAKLPEAERAEWAKLWADVAELLKRAEAK